MVCVFCLQNTDSLIVDERPTMMNAAVPHFVIVNDGDDGEGSETIHTAVTDKTGSSLLPVLGTRLLYPMTN